MTPDAPADPRRRILDVALALGEQRGWDAVHLHEVAPAAGVTLAELLRHFEHKDALAEAWFDRADAALHALPQSPGWLALRPRDRVHRAVFAWLDTLAPHRRVTFEMLRYKFQPEHLHLQAQGIVRISRTVQAMREVAQLPEVGWRRELGEAALTSIYLSTLARWMSDSTPGASATHAFLDRLLALAERTALRMSPRRTERPT